MRIRRQSDRYKKQKDEYYAAYASFIRSHPETMSGMELELDGVNPQRKWEQIANDHKKHIQHLAPDVAQTNICSKSGHRSGRPRRCFRIASRQLLDQFAESGCRRRNTRVRWDVPVSINRAKPTRIELTNLNATDTRAAASNLKPSSANYGYVSALAIL